jgi:NADH dehydrogenase/NADH:ubiquinone oxidoreductase subunit G
MSFLDNYEPVADRISKFWAMYPQGRLHTEIVLINETEIVIKASAYTDRDDPRPAAIDFAQETRGSSNINKQSFIENCSTSALGRVLATLNFQPKKDGKAVRPSREEMKAVSKASVAQTKDYLSLATVEALAGNLEALRAIYKDAQGAGVDADDLKKIADLASSLK